MNDAEKLLKMQKQIETAKTENAQIEGANNQTLANLKSEFGINDLKSAKKKMKSFQRKEQDKSGLLHDGIEDLENEYEW